MRWFVEVSRVGDNSSDEKYCVEAKQWQAALQEARKLRGDSGPLSKFSIELLDDGYRAVDPKLKLRFLVAKAPQDAELSTEGAPHLNGQSASAPSVAPVPTPSLAPPVAKTAPAPAVAFVPSVSAPSPARGLNAGLSARPPVVGSAVPASVSNAPAFAAAHAEPYAGVPSSNLSPHSPGTSAQAAAPAAGSGATGAAPGFSKSPSAFPPRPSAGREPSAPPPAGAGVLSDVIPPAPALPRGLGPPIAQPQHPTQPSAAIDLPPPASVLRKRHEEPTVESPITYREVAYVVEPGVSRGSVEALLWASFRDISRELADRPGQKFVQLAVFDHKFEKRPERAPLGTLAWKDWRGNPVITFPFFDGTAPARASMPPSSMPPRSVSGPSIKPQPVVKISSSLPPVGREPVPSAPPTTVAPSPTAAAAGSISALPPPVSPLAGPRVLSVAPPPASVVAPSSELAARSVAPSPPRPAAEAAPPVSAAPRVEAAPPVSAAPRVEAAPPVSAAPRVEAAPPVSAAPPASAAPRVEAATPVSAPPPLEAAPVLGGSVTGQPPPVLTPEPSAAIPLTREKLPSHPSGTRSSRPRMAAVRRRAGEDLIGELFETMHDLHFMHGVADGAEFMLAAIDSVVPCDGVLVHVFDINTRQFVVVRAKGPGAIAVLMHRTPDSEPFFSAIMRRPGSIAIHDVEKDPRILGSRWDVLGVKPQRALCGPVRQGGRYLGLIEVINPLGDAPFHQNEQNAIDYVCEQFAQFLLNRPLVLEPDVILRR